jgi:hypothetical protein
MVPTLENSEVFLGLVVGVAVAVMKPPLSTDEDTGIVKVKLVGFASVVVVVAV